MKIGIYFSSNKNNGGVYQYSLSFLDALKEIKGQKFIIFNDSSEILNEYADDFNIENLNNANENLNNKIHLKNLKKIIFRFGYRLISRLHLNFIINIFGFLTSMHLLFLIKKQKINIMIFLGYNYAANFLSIPVINIIYDLQHRINPQFPEVSKNGINRMREYFYRRMTKNSDRILADSETGKRDIIRFYNFPADKIVILPFLAPKYLIADITTEEAIKILATYKLPEKFLFYPAQLWPHKNHLNILKAINKLKDSGLTVNAVFCGTKKDEFGVYKQMEKYINENNLCSQIFYLGYVDNKIISALYRLAVAMIMPTFFGPTNIPVLEAWKVGCPVIYSDIPGCREQLCDAGLLINPNCYKDIATKITLIWNNDPLRQELIAKGKKQLGKWTYFDFATKIKDMINELISQTYGTKNNQLQ
ncbi:MAG: glycosyltransferase family 1 protein [Patescibacteria group bacterium]